MTHEVEITRYVYGKKVNQESDKFKDINGFYPFKFFKDGQFILAFVTFIEVEGTGLVMSVIGSSEDGKITIHDKHIIGEKNDYPIEFQKSLSETWRMHIHYKSEEN